MRILSLAPIAAALFAAQLAGSNAAPSLLATANLQAPERQFIQAE